MWDSMASQWQNGIKWKQKINISVFPRLIYNKTISKHERAREKPKHTGKNTMPQRATEPLMSIELI